MSDMTWKGFKEEVERQMKEKDIPEDAPISYIDISYPGAHDELVVVKDDTGGLTVG